MSDDDDTPVKEKIYATPESKDKTSSKFKNILDDLELKMPKPKSFVKKMEQDSINSKLDTNNSNSISNNKNSMKDLKPKTISNNKNDNNIKTNNYKQNPKIRKFNSFEEGSLKNNKNKTNNSKSKTNENIDKNKEKDKEKDKDKIYNEKNKTKKFIKINSLTTFTSGTKSAGNLSVRLNHDNRFNRNDLIITKKNMSNSNSNSNNNSKNKKEKLRPSTPGIRNLKENNSNSKNNNTNQNTTSNININNVNNREKRSSIPKTNAVDPLYIPHIVKDPLDILRHQVDLILQQSNEDISNLSNSISLIDMEMESSYAKIHENYAKELQEIYKEKETKLRETNKKYDFALYKMFKTYGHENNIIYDEMMKDKVEQILEVEQEFNAKKNQIKNNFNTKMDEIKKNYEKKRNEQEMKNAKTIKEIKNKIFAILYDDIKKNDNNKNSSIDNKKVRRKKAISMNKK